MNEDSSDKNLFFQLLLKRAILAPIILSCFLSGIFIFQLHSLRLVALRVDHADQVIAQANQLQKLLLDAETGVRGFLINYEPIFLETYHAALKTLPIQLEKLQTLTLDPEQLKILKTVQAQTDQWLNYQQNTIEEIQKNKVHRSRKYPLRRFLGKFLMDQIRAEIVNFVQIESQIRNERLQTWERESRNTLIAGLLILIFLAFFISTFTRRSLSALSTSYQTERKLREQFVSTLSYDLRTPLTAAKMNAQILVKKPNLPADYEKLSKRIILSINRVDQMICDLLDANRIRAGETIALEFEACNLNQIAIETLDELKLVYGDHFLLSAHEAIYGFWSPNGIRRILENLCANAIKYGFKNSPITVSLKLLGDDVSIEVHNEGKPIPKNDQGTLFEAFSRTSSAQKSGQKGWGLGLTLVKAIAAGHGGKVDLKSEEGIGTTFSVILPRDAQIPLAHRT